MISKPGFTYSLNHYDKFGRLLYKSPIWKNIIVDEGLNYFNDVSLTSGTQITSFYVLLFGDNYTPLGTETYTSPGFTEFISYDETTRQLWNHAGTSNAEATNADNPAIFTMSAGTEGVTVYGAAIVGGGTAADTKSDTAGGGILVSIQKFPAAQIVNPGNKITFTCTHRMRR